MADKLWLGNVGTAGDYSVAANWSPSGVPSAADNVSIPAGSPSITAGLDQSAVAIGSFTVERGYTGAIGTSSAYLQIDPDSFEFSGTGTAYIDIGSAAISPTIRTTATATTGNAGLYLLGSAIATLHVEGGNVSVAHFIGETSTIATARINGGAVRLNSGVTLTTLLVNGGSATLRAAATTITINGGTVATEGSGAVTTVNANAGTFDSGSSGTITTLAIAGGVADFSGSAVSRTVTTTTVASNGGTLICDESIVTLTNKPTATGPLRRTYSR